MALTNFAALTDEQKTVWSREFWKLARNNSFIMQFSGSGPNSMIQQINDLTKSEKGARAVMTLIHDLEGDGVTGDNTLEGNEETIRSSDTVITIDQLRNANRLSGRMADQRSIINFRETSRDVLAYWFADRIDQIAFLILSGIGLEYRNNGATRPSLATGLNLANLEFASQISAPSSARHLMMSAVTRSNTIGSGGAVQPFAGGSFNANQKLSYRGIVNLQAYMKDHYIRGVRGGGNDEMYHMFVTPQIMASLKLDQDFIDNMRHAGTRGDGNNLFKGSESVMVDGMMVHEFRHVYHNHKAADKSAHNNVDVTRVLVCGAQALGMCDLGSAEWIEDTFDYGNQSAISIQKIMGFLKPKFKPVSHTTDDYMTVKQDFGVVAVDVAG
tara:strand:+ start:1767 stop:2921 length:1155 start_codon:yes stop_codon:yes gene_type:complete